MIAYLDTSSLVKLYVEEDGADAIKLLVDQASVVVTSVIAYPEARSAFARLHRERGLSDEEYESLKADLERDWSSFLTLNVTEKIWRQAGDIAERHALRGFDSLHLASYRELADLQLTQPVRFSSFDKRLNNALQIT